jgi:hypothetical protein
VYETARVGRPPRATPWAPHRVADHARPLLATYVGFNSRIGIRNETDALFAVKHQARDIFCSAADNLQKHGACLICRRMDSCL